MTNNIVVTGKGIICAIGNNCKEVTQSLKKQKSGIASLQYLSSTHKQLPVGEVKLSTAEMRAITNITDNFISRTTLMNIIAIKEALKESNIEKYITENKTARIVLVNGTTVAGMDVTEKFFSQIKHSNTYLDCINYHTAGKCSEIISQYFNCFVDYITISTACSSSANAIIVGAEMLKNNEADIVIASGSESLSIFHLNGFHSLMILDKEPCRPFDNNRKGINLGEGAASIVLEREDLARKRNANIFAYLTGYANTCDAFHQTASSENGEGAFLAMNQALEKANLKPKDIQYINAHGTGTPNNDSSESIAIKRLFKDEIPLISSTKSFTGHTTSASGSIESVICLLAMQENFIPANLNFSCPMPEGISPTLHKENQDLQNVICNSFGFGGNDSSLIFSQKNNITTSKIINKITEDDILTIARHEITTEDELKEIVQYIKPLEARRMGKSLKGAMLCSLKVLKEAKITTPDAIIAGTDLGLWENTENLLEQINSEGEVMLKPTYFMQSTHNTIASTIAIHTKCHGYNITYSNGKKTFDCMLKDAKRKLLKGECKNVLLCLAEETTTLYRNFEKRIGKTESPSIHCLALLLSCSN